MEFQKVLETRRTVRKYSAGVTREQMEELLRAAQEAPSWKNSQTGRYYCVLSEEMVDKIRVECLPDAGNAGKSEHAALIITTFVHDRAGFQKDGSADNELVEGALAEGLHGVHVHHVGQILVVPDGDLLDLVGGAEAVKEVDKGDAALDGCQVGHGAQVHDLLGVGLAQHGKAGLAAGHDVGMVAEDVQRVGGHGTGGHVKHGGHQLTGQLVHVGNHQQQALGGGVGGGQSARGQIEFLCIVDICT